MWLYVEVIDGLWVWVLIDLAIFCVKQLLATFFIWAHIFVFV